MSPEEKEAIDRLLAKDASAAQQKTALKWFAEYFEESHILNISISKDLFRALDSFSRSRSVDSALQTRAKNLLKKYRR